MDYRQDAFRQKFADAAGHLEASPDALVSLKIRDNVGGHREYHESLRMLVDETRTHSTGIQSNFQGNGYLVQSSKTKVIVVEHETGLEILYVAGSIASLLGLIPLILRCWSVIREHGHRQHRHGTPDLHRIETRRLSSQGDLIEDHSNGLAVPWAAPLSIMNTAMLSAAESIDSEIQELKRTVHTPAQRLEAIEKTPRTSGRKKKAAPKKKKTTAPRKAKP
ncbi:MAG: hypothetical protein ISS78_05210 [Phycisphaerae bacterium]|nr:hypothetical protein [Phycisphaerae bacterium]